MVLARADDRTGVKLLICICLHGGLLNKIQFLEYRFLGTPRPTTNLHQVAIFFVIARVLYWENSKQLNYYRVV